MREPTEFSDMNGKSIYVGDVLDIFGLEVKVIKKPETAEKFWVRMPNGVEAPLWAKNDSCTIKEDL